MNSIAFFMENSSISYSAIYTALGAAAALICTAITSVFFHQKLLPVMTGAAVSMVTGTLFARIVYWYCCQEQFDGFLSVFTDFGSGGFSLVGAFIGVLLAALAVKLSGLTDSLPALLDCFAPGAALGIAIGRLGGFFSNDDKGNFIFTDSRFHGLPLSVPVQDSVTGSVEWRFASFLWESIAGFVIFAALIALMLILPDNDSRSSHRGDIFMAFISLFGATQATLESTRYDALHMRSNGFISMMQMAALVMLLVPLVYYSIRLVRLERSARGIIPCCALSLAALVGAGVAEYFVQRRANQAMAIYPVQLLLLLVTSLLTFMLARRMYMSPDAACEEADEDFSIYSDTGVAEISEEEDLRAQIDSEFGAL